MLDPRHLVVVNDHNYPFSVGRHLGTGRTDDDDLIEVALGQPLARLGPVAGGWNGASRPVR